MVAWVEGNKTTHTAQNLSGEAAQKLACKRAECPSVLAATELVDALEEVRSFAKIAGEWGANLPTVGRWHSSTGKQFHHVSTIYLSKMNVPVSEETNAGLKATKDGERFIWQRQQQQEKIHTSMGNCP